MGGMHPQPSLEERALGAYLGLAVGDALGATVEFMTAGEIRAQHGVHRQLVGGGWLRLRPGQVTDDTEMSLALGRAIVSGRSWNLKSVAESYVAWMRSCPIDIGNTCRRGIRRYLLDGTLQAPASEDHAGNGAAMRNLPVVLATLDDEAAFERWSLEQAHLTHQHPLSDAGLLAAGRLTRILLRGGTLGDCRKVLDALIERHPQFRFEPWPGQSSGYIVDTLQTVLHPLFRTDSFEDYLVQVVNRGGDADTTGAIAGQLGGALYGVRDIPAAWLQRLDPRVASAVREQTARLLEFPGHDLADSTERAPPPHGRFRLLARSAATAGLAAS